VSKCRILASILLGYYSFGVQAAPIETDNLIEIFQLNYPDAYSQYSTDTYFQNTYSAGVEAYGDLTTGKVGSRSESADGTNSIVSLYDTLSFDAAAEVEFSFSLDGILASASQFDHPYGQGRIDIYDITGLDNWLVEGDLFGIPQVAVSAEAQDQSISANTVLIDMDGIDGFQTGVGEFSEDANLSRDGSLHEVAYELNGSFIVDPTRVYGIRLTANTFSRGEGSIANFLNTGTFAFTDLGGASFTSGSGSFLSAQQPPVEVSEPSGILFLGFGLIALFARSFKQLRSAT
jgi:hypothetical protein